MSDSKDEIVITHLFKANDMIAESDILFRFEVRELIRRAKDLPPVLIADILRDEAQLLTAVYPSDFIEQLNDDRPY